MKLDTIICHRRALKLDFVPLGIIKKIKFYDFMISFKGKSSPSFKNKNPTGLGSL